MGSKNMTLLQRAWKFLGSMKFAVILLLVLILSCAAGSFVTQGQSYEWYAMRYSETAAAAIKLFQLDDVFHCWWFVAITLFLCLNLIFCNVVRFLPLVKRYQKEGKPEEYIEKRAAARAVFETDGEKKTDALFSALGMGKVLTGTDGSGRRWKFASSNRAGIWGAWVCHLGILILIAGFGLGQITKKEYTVYGVPGQAREIGDTSLILSIDSFEIGLREDDTVEQYTAGITVRDVSAGTGKSAEISVNHPASLFGMKFYQNSTGWAAKITVQKNGEEIQSEVVCAGDYMEITDKPGLTILFSAFYPDYALDPDRGPISRSSKLDNQGYLYRACYMDQVIGMNVLTGEDVITIDEYTVVFSDPQSYTLIQIKRDPFTPFALLGGLVVMIGLILSLYIQPKKVWAIQQENGFWVANGESRKGGALFEERFKRAAEVSCGEE